MKIYALPMRHAAGGLVIALAIAAPVSRLKAQSGLDQAQPFGAFFNGKFPATSPGSTPGGSWTTQNAFPALSFPEPVRIVEHPRANKLVVVSKTGPVWIFDNTPQTSTKQLLLDLTSKTNYPEVGEGGVSGFAFHPDYGKATSPNRGYIYVSYRFTRASPASSYPNRRASTGFPASPFPIAPAPPASVLSWSSFTNTTASNGTSAAECSSAATVFSTSGWGMREMPLAVAMRPSGRTVVSGAASSASM